MAEITVALAPYGDRPASDNYVFRFTRGDRHADANFHREWFREDDWATIRLVVRTIIKHLKAP